jgi:antitoxin component YwqK of YwqJK toxin-antitoxin module
MKKEPLIDDDEHDVWPPDNFTGEWAFYWPNRQLKYRALYLNGETEGEVLCYWGNGQIAQRGISDGGQCRGIWTDYSEDGTKFKETEYRDNRNFTVRFFGLHGDITSTYEYRDGIQTSVDEVASSETT